MLLVWLGAVVVATVLLGARPATLAELRHQVATGGVTAVTVEGGSGTEGESVLGLRWQTAFLTSRTDVLRTTSPGSGTSGQVAWSGPPQDVVGPAFVEELTRSAPGGVLEVTTQPLRLGSWALAGWDVPGWVAVAGATWALAAFMSLVAGPQPRLGTRWAWGWMVLALGVPALVPYLVLGLRRPLADDAVPPGRRLTGGWAFVLAMLLGGSAA